MCYIMRWISDHCSGNPAQLSTAKETDSSYNVPISDVCIDTTFVLLMMGIKSTGLGCPVIACSLTEFQENQSMTFRSKIGTVDGLS